MARILLTFDLYMLLAIDKSQCHNPNLGLATKAKGWKVTGQEGDLGVTSHAPRSAKSVRE